MAEKKMIYRRKVILSILETFDKEVTAKKMQKYLFIFTRMQCGDKLYDFVPYKYGCFSFQANQDIVSLSNLGYISIVNEEHAECFYKLEHLTHYRNELSIFDLEIIDNLKKQFYNFSQDSLIAYTYKRWPFTAINSVIKEKILTKEDLEKVNQQKNRFKNSDPMLMTIGYEGFSLEKYLQRLITNSVNILCDVRKNAFSQKYGFSKGILQKACEGVGIKYIHIPQLGIENSQRKNLFIQQDYDRLFENYEQTTLIENWPSVLFIQQLLIKGNRVCLTCFEKDPKQCHRTRVANALMSISDNKYSFDNLLL